MPALRACVPGLTAWDGEDPEGADGIEGTEDDFVAPSLAISWTTNYADVVANITSQYTITFTLRPRVTFHDGSPWNAEAARLNFNQVQRL